MSAAVKHLLSAVSVIVIIALIPIAVVTAGKAYRDKERSSSEVRIGISLAPVTMDPHHASDIGSAEYLNLCHGCLYSMYDGNKVEPELAEGYDLSKDGCTYTFHLRDNIYYHDGTPITAYDFVYSWQRLADPETRSTAVYNLTECMSLKNAEEVIRGELPPELLGVSAPDRRTFVVELNQPCPYMLSLVSSSVLCPVNEEFVKRMGDKYCTSPETMLFSGPYVLDRYIPLDPQMHFTKNPNYLFADSISTSGITFRQISNPQQAMMCYQAGDFDIVQASGETVDLVAGNKDLHTVGSGNALFFLFNSQRPSGVNNKNIRAALCHSVDREQITKYVLKHGYYPLYSIVPPNFAAEPDGSDFAAGAKERYEGICGYDPEKAREYWEAGLAEEGITELTLTLVTTKAEAMEPIKDSMEKTLPGLTVEVRQNTVQQVSQTVASGDFDIIQSGWIADYPDPKSMIECLTPDTVINGESWSNEEYTYIAHNNCLETDPAKRSEMLHKAEDILMEDRGIIPYYYNGINWLVSDRIDGVMFNYRGCMPICIHARKEG